MCYQLKILTLGLVLVFSSYYNGVVCVNSVFVLCTNWTHNWTLWSSVCQLVLSQKVTPWNIVHLEKLIVTQSEILCLLWIPKVCYCVHKNVPLSPVLSQINVLHILRTYLIASLLLAMYLVRICQWSTHVFVGLPSGLFHSGYPTKMLYAAFGTPCMLQDLLILKFNHLNNILWRVQIMYFKFSLTFWCVLALKFSASSSQAQSMLIG